MRAALEQLTKIANAVPDIPLIVAHVNPDNGNIKNTIFWRNVRYVSPIVYYCAMANQSKTCEWAKYLISVGCKKGVILDEPFDYSGYYRQWLEQLRGMAHPGMGCACTESLEKLIEEKPAVYDQVEFATAVQEISDGVAAMALETLCEDTSAALMAHIPRFPLACKFGDEYASRLDAMEEIISTQMDGAGTWYVAFEYWDSDDSCHKIRVFLSNRQKMPEIMDLTCGVLLAIQQQQSGV
jgi:hypothetical protein